MKYNEARAHWKAALTEILDEPLGRHGFQRRKQAWKYQRTRGEAFQILEMHFSRSRYAPTAEYSQLVVGMMLDVPPATCLIQALCAGTEAEAIGAFTFYERVGVEYQDGHTLFWEGEGEAGIQQTTRDLRDHLLQWTIPFLDEYCSVEALVAAHQNQARWLVGLDDFWVVRLTACYLLCRRQSEALEFIQARFRAARKQRVYHDIIERVRAYPLGIDPSG